MAIWLDRGASGTKEAIFGKSFASKKVQGPLASESQNQYSISVSVYT